jgi:squalene synthase HpnC
MPVDHYENFPVASLLLPKRLRRPVEAIYRFARAADDIADEGDATDAQRLQGLAEFAEALDRIERGEHPAQADFAELAAVIHAWRLPVALFRDLLDAFAQDVVTRRYADYPQLLDYCRRSANPVGRLLLHLVGRADAENLRRSDCICSALQLVNFWQDIAIDWQKERVYLPQADLERFRHRRIADRGRMLERRMGGATGFRNRADPPVDACRRPAGPATARPHGLGNPLDGAGRPAHSGADRARSRRCVRTAAGAGRARLVAHRRTRPAHVSRGRMATLWKSRDCE